MFSSKNELQTYISKKIFFRYTSENSSNIYLKVIHEREKYLNLSIFENRNAISKLRTSSHKLASTIGKWYKNDDMKICKYCNEGTIENEFHLIFSCDNYTESRNDTFKFIKEIDNFDLQKGNKLQNLHIFFSHGSLKALNAIGKFIKQAFEKREITTETTEP